MKTNRKIKNMKRVLILGKSSYIGDFKTSIKLIESDEKQ